jgi:hypothetical protein
MMMTMMTMSARTRRVGGEAMFGPAASLERDVARSLRRDETHENVYAPSRASSSAEV